MLRKEVSFIVAVVMIFSFSTSFADLDSYMDKALQEYQQYYQEPGVYESGTRGYVSLGAYSLRIPDDKISTGDISAIRPPRLNFSCSGIDFEAGGFSYVDWDYIKESVKTSGSSLLAGFFMGLAYSVPTIKNVLDQIQKISNMANQLYFEPCKVGEMMGKGDWKGAQSYFTDQYKADSMGTGESSSAPQAHKKAVESRVAHLPDGNLVYEQLKNLGYPEEDITPVINITGTVVFKKYTNEEGQQDWEGKEIFGYVTPDVLLNGGTVSYVTFSGSKYEIATTNKTTITGLIKDNETKLKAIIEKIANGTKISKDDEAFLTDPVSPKSVQLVMDTAKIPDKNQRNILATGIAAQRSYHQVKYILEKTERAFRFVYNDPRLKDVKAMSEMVARIYKDFLSKRAELDRLYETQIKYKETIIDTSLSVGQAFQRILGQSGLSTKQSGME